MKKCPFCAEEIQDEAVKCRFCNEIIAGNPFLAKQEQQDVKKVPWYCNPGALWISFILFLPFSVFWCVPLTWIHPRWSRTTKIITSITMIVLASCLTTTVMKMAGNIQNYYSTGGINLF